MARWLDRLINKQRANAARQSAAGAQQSEQRAWVVRALDPGDAAKCGMPLRIAANADVRVGHRCLVVAGINVVAVGVVLGESTGKRRTRAVRTLLVTHQITEPFEITRPLGSARAVPSEDYDWKALRDARPIGWDFVLDASEELDSRSRQLPPKTLEKHAEEFLVKVLEGAGMQARGQVALPNTQDPDVLRPRPLRADVVVTWSDHIGPHALVVEGEWTQPGGAQSAAQAYEYARHLQTLHDDEPPVGFDGFPFRKAAVHAVVVANRCPKNCVTADALGVERFDYAKFVALIARRDFVQLPVIVR